MARHPCDPLQLKDQDGRKHTNMTVRMRRSVRFATWLAVICAKSSPRKVAKVTGGGPSLRILASICWNQARLSSDESTSETTSRPADGRSSRISSRVAGKLVEESAAHG